MILVRTLDRCLTLPQEEKTDDFWTAGKKLKV
jgi:hypothetical protein